MNTTCPIHPSLLDQTASPNLPASSSSVLDQQPQRKQSQLSSFFSRKWQQPHKGINQTLLSSPLLDHKQQTSTKETHKLSPLSVTHDQLQTAKQIHKSVSFFLARHTQTKQPKQNSISLFFSKQQQQHTAARSALPSLSAKTAKSPSPSLILISNSNICSPCFLLFNFEHNSKQKPKSECSPSATLLLDQNRLINRPVSFCSSSIKHNQQTHQPHLSLNRNQHAATQPASDLSTSSSSVKQ